MVSLRTWLLISSLDHPSWENHGSPKSTMHPSEINNASVISMVLSRKCDSENDVNTKGNSHLRVSQVAVCDGGGGLPQGMVQVLKIKDLWRAALSNWPPNWPPRQRRFFSFSRFHFLCCPIGASWCPHRSRRYRASRSLGADIRFIWCNALMPLSMRISSSNRCAGTSIL